MNEDILHRLYQAYRVVSRERQRISVPIDLVIKEAGLWERREDSRQILEQNRRLLQLDQGDWASATEDTRSVYVTDPMRTENWLGKEQARKLIYMAFTEEPGGEKEIGVLRYLGGTVYIDQGGNRIVVRGVEKLSALIEQLKSCQFLMSSKRLAEIEREVER